VAGGQAAGRECGSTTTDTSTSTSTPTSTAVCAHHGAWSRTGSGTGHTGWCRCARHSVQLLGLRVDKSRHLKASQPHVLLLSSRSGSCRHTTSTSTSTSTGTDTGNPVCCAGGRVAGTF